MSTTSRGAPYPGPGDPPNVPADIFALAQWITDHIDDSAGVYAPTFTAGTNLSAATGYADGSFWTRVGDIVTATVLGSVDPISAIASRLEVSLPVASNLASLFDLTGTAVVGVGGAAVAVGTVAGSAANNRAVIDFLASGTALTEVRATFSYKVI